MYRRMIRRHGAVAAGVTAALSALLFLVCLSAAGCGRAQTDGARQPNTEDKRLKVVTTLFPYYDFLRQIGGDRIDLTMVIPAGMDSHSFEPTPADMILIQNADLAVCNGGEMEQWFTKVTESFGDGPAPGRIVTMMDYVDTVEEEIVEGMEEEAHDHSHDAEIEYDEHIWTSPVNAIRLTGILADVLAQEDPENSEFYRANETEYVEELKEIDAEFRNIVGNSKRKTVIFGDKFPFRYFFDEYGLQYRAAFSGCSSDTEPSAKTIAYLIDKVEKETIPAIYYLELSSPRVAEIVGEETGAEPLLFHSCHNVTRKEFDSGVTYLDLMRQNAVNLRKGLN